MSSYQYALHAGGERAQDAGRWAASLKLTPELLEKLQSSSDLRVFLSINTATTSKSQRSELLLKDANADVVDKYELHSFREDGNVNHVCAFEYQEPKQGFDIVKQGSIHQKMIVQRLLDRQEQDRIKDKHERSVEESKSRTSKLLDKQPAQRKRRMVVYKPTVSSSAKDSSGPVISLPSALGSQEAADMIENLQQEDEPEPAEQETPTPKEPIPKEPTPKEPAPKEPAPKESTPKEPAPKKQKTTVPAYKPVKEVETPAPKTNSKEEQVQLIDRVVNSTQKKNVKRAKVRNSKLPEVVKRLPEEVQQVCKCLNEKFLRAAIVDDEDLRIFQTQYDNMAAYWHVLDKAYSIYYIKSSAKTLESKSTSQSEQEVVSYLEQTMLSLQHSLSSLQSSISTYIDSKSSQ